MLSTALWSVHPFICCFDRFEKSLLVGAERPPARSAQYSRLWCVTARRARLQIWAKKRKKEVRNPSEVIHLLSPDNRNQQSLMWRRSGNVSHSKACFQAETRWWGGDSDITGVTEWENVWREEGSTDSYSMYMGVCVLKMSAGPTHTHSRYRDVTSNTPCPSPACQCTSLSHAALVSSLH